MIEDVSVNQILLAVAVFVGSIVLAGLLRVVLVRALDRGDADKYVGRLLGRFLSLVVVAFGAVYALGIADIRIGPILGALGVGGIALAFAAQDILENLVAGVLLQVRRPFRVGDQISSGDYDGTVKDINLRTVKLTSYDGLTVYLPNADVLQAPIVNYTRTPLSRTTLTVGVSYDADLETARQVLLAACRSVEAVPDDPPTEVWVEEFGDSSINLSVLFWHKADIASLRRTRNDVAVSVKRHLDDAGITIPFPQRTLWFGPGETTLSVRREDAG